ncbi:hypothetical protein ASD15_12080 [Massilia sp. Root351]|jgi:hypothetical protein|uniref:hypothetical protein n=1 Tax=Massilia sp. Root351 TaxID=1736522 RepID=UPI00070E47B7|nr:hypothetical protein [Massilia sp. Root351]KQV80670.1 hypothetical protein ASD15_12080 [Massilia sp. Root351]
MRPPGIALLLLLLQASAAAEVDVQLKLLSPEALEVSYTLPAACRALPFAKHGDAGRATREAWQALDGCGTAGAGELARQDAACSTLRFRVPAATRQAGYPAAFPMGQGLYAHLSNYAVGDGCGKVNYRFAAPGIAVNGRSYEHAAEAQSGADTAALLLAAPLAQPGAETPSYFDPRLPAATVAHIGMVAAGTVGYLRKALPDAVFQRPIVAAAYVAAPGGVYIGGDASDVLRLALYNWPRAPSAADQAKATLLVAHEFSHRFQLRDAVDDYPDARLIHEGGGEFLRWMASIHNGWLTPAQAAEELDDALATCILYSEPKSWRALTPRQVGGNRLEYKCGLPAYVYALAARQGQGSAMARINGFYRSLRQGARPDFAHAMECGAGAAATPACQPRWLPKLLGADGSMEQQWDSMLDSTALATPQPPTQAMRDAMVLRAVVKLMQDDCGGRSGTTETPHGVILDGMKACKTFLQEAHATTIEGLPVFGHPGTGQAMAAACTARRQVLLGLQDGGTLAVPCQHPYRMRQQFHRADIDKVLNALRAG